MENKDYSFIILATLLVIVGVSVSVFSVVNNPADDLNIPIVVKKIKMSEIPAAPAANSYLSINKTIILPLNVTEENSKIALDTAKNIVDEMQRQGFNNFYVRDLYIEAENAFNGKDVDKILEELDSVQNNAEKESLSKLYLEIKNAANDGRKFRENYTLVFERAVQIQKRQQQTYELADAINVLKDVVSSLNRTVVNFSEVDTQFALINLKFHDEQFDGLLPLIDDTYSKIDHSIIESSRLRAVYKASKRTLLNFVVARFKSLLIGLAISFIAGLIFFNEIQIIRLARMIDDKERERRVIALLVKKSQESYYLNNKISRNMYSAKIKQYRSKIIRLNSDIPVLKKNMMAKSKYRKYYSFKRQSQE